MNTSMGRGRILLAATVLAVVCAAIFFTTQRAKHKALARESLATIVQKSDDMRPELLALYKQRLKLANDLLAALSAQPLDNAWTHTDQWKMSTASEMAALDSIQSQISNHISRVLSKVQIYAPRKRTKAALLLGEFERFEQTIVRKRNEYTSLANDFTLKNIGDYPSDRIPQFPAEMALQRKTNTK